MGYFLGIFFGFLEANFALASTFDWKYDFPFAAPYSKFIELPESGLTTPFCEEWNPDFPYRGGQCCAKVPRRGTNSAGFCPAKRAKSSFCDEMTEEQVEYLEKAKAGKLDDVLETIQQDARWQETQAFCTPNNGFLVWGRPLIPSEKNKIVLRRPGRCVNFGTDRMIAMLESIGRKIHLEFAASEPRLKLLVGDIAAPRGGCLKGRGGTRGHSSHTSGQDVDLGFLSPKGKNLTQSFHSKFDPERNWWLIQQIFNNAFVCVKSIFLDRNHIRKLGKYIRTLGKEDEIVWDELKPHIKHARNHKNHFHIRIGDNIGPAGCRHHPAAEDIEELEEDET